MTSVRTVPTPYGDARLHTDRSRHPIATLLLGHGAGGGPESADLVALGSELPREGITVIRLEQPWRVAGKKIAPAPKILDACLVAVADRLREIGWYRGLVGIGGISASTAASVVEAGASGVAVVSAVGAAADPTAAARGLRAEVDRALASRSRSSRAGSGS